MTDPIEAEARRMTEAWAKGGYIPPKYLTEGIHPDALARVRNQAAGDAAGRQYIEDAIRSYCLRHLRIDPDEIIDGKPRWKLYIDTAREQLAWAEAFKDAAR